MFNKYVVEVIKVQKFSACVVNPLGQRFPLKTQGYPLRRLLVGYVVSMAWSMFANSWIQV